MKNIRTPKRINIFIVSYIKNWILPPSLDDISRLNTFSTNNVIKSDNHFIPNTCSVKKLNTLIKTLPKKESKKFDIKIKKISLINKTKNWYNELVLF